MTSPAARTLLPLFLCTVAGPALAQEPVAATSPPAGSSALTQVARFQHQVTGVTVAQDGRIFVNFPRWTEDSLSRWQS